jgi:hypothetical protein
MEVAITNGTDASTRIIENFIPIKEASNIVIGTLQIADAPM